MNILNMIDGNEKKTCLFVLVYDEVTFFCSALLLGHFYAGSQALWRSIDFPLCFIYRLGDIHSEHFFSKWRKG